MRWFYGQAAAVFTRSSSYRFNLRDLGVAVNEVRTGRAYVIDGQVPRAELEQIAGKGADRGSVELSADYESSAKSRLETLFPNA